MEKLLAHARRGSLMIMVMIAFLLSSVVLGQDAPATAPQKAPEFSGLKLLQPDDTNLVVFGDVLPVVRRVLGNANVQKMIKEGRLGKAIADESGEEADADAWLKTVEAQSIHIPTEIIMAMPDSALAQIGHTFTLFLQGSLAQAMKNDGGDAAKDLPRLQKEMLAELKMVQMPRLTFYIRFRTKADPQLAMAAIRVQAGNLQQSMPDVITVAARRVTVKLKMADRMDDNTIIGALTQLGIVDDADNETCKAITDAVKNLSLFASIDMVDSGLKITVGPDESTPATGLADEALGKLWKADPATLMYMNWNLKAWHDAVGEIGKAWDSWEKTPAGKLVVEMDKQSLLQNMRTMIDQSKSGGNHVSARIWTDDALRMEELDDSALGTTSLADAPWITMIPPGTDTVALSGGPSFGQEFRSMIDQFEQALSRGNDPKMEDFRDRIQKPLNDLRATAEKMSSAFGPTTATIVTPDGKLKKMTIVGTKDGEKKTVTLENIGIMEMASMAVAKDAPAAEKLIRDAADQFVRGVVAAADKDVKDVVALHEEDLGLGVKTYAFNTDWMSQLAKPDDLAITIDGDLKPHFFILNNVAVMSSSPRLSKEIVAAAKAGKKFPLPSGVVIGYTHTGTRTAVGGITMIGDIVRDVSKSLADSPEAIDEEKSKQAVEVIMGIAEMATMMEKAQAVARNDGHWNHATAEMTFQEGHLIPAPKEEPKK